MVTFKFLLMSLLATGIAVAQEQPAEQPSAMQHHHGGFMQEGMQHAVAKGVTLDAKVDVAARIVTLRVGPVNLPANTGHMKMPQPPDQVWQIPFDGWLLAYHPRLVDANGQAVPGTVLHPTAFWDENRAHFLCPKKENDSFPPGSEMPEWAGDAWRVDRLAN